MACHLGVPERKKNKRQCFGWTRTIEDHLLYILYCAPKLISNLSLCLQKSNIERAKNLHLYHHVPKDAGDKIQLEVPLYNLPAEFI